MSQKIGGRPLVSGLSKYILFLVKKVSLRKLISMLHFLKLLSINESNIISSELDLTILAKITMVRLYSTTCINYLLLFQTRKNLNTSRNN